MDRSLSPWRSRIVGHGDADPRELVENPRNWRTHPDYQRQALAGILNEVGWVAEVLVNQRTGFVVDGHLRVAAAVQRGEVSVPVRYVDLEDAEERLVLAAFDPISALAGSNTDQLATLLEGLTPADEAVANLLRELTPPRAKVLNPDDADLTPPEEPITKPGDLWLLGEHRLLCGDATNANHVAQVLSGAEPPLLITDPPYGVQFDPTWRTAFGAIKDEYMDAEADTERGWGQAWRHAPATVAYVWHSDQQRWELESDFRQMGWTFRQEIVWTKQAWAMSRTLWAYRHESCLFLTRGETHWIGPRHAGGKNALEHTTVWPDLPVSSPFGSESSDPLDDDDGIRHATQKPVALMRRPMEHHAGDVYEPFCGSGTTLIAAEEMNRRCYAMEIQPRFIDVIVRRWERVSGRQAVKANA